MNYDDIERERVRQRGPITLPIIWEVVFWVALAVPVFIVAFLFWSLVL